MLTEIIQDESMTVLNYLILFCASLVLCSVGFKNFVYFMSVGYGFAIAGLAILLALLFPRSLTLASGVALLVFVLYGARLSGFLLYREFRNKNYDKNIAVEVPLIFDSHRQNLFQYLVGVETTKQLKHLLERGGNANQLLFNERNSYDKHRQELDYILKSDGTKKELENQVVSVIKDRKEKQK